MRSIHPKQEQKVFPSITHGSWGWVLKMFTILELPQKFVELVVSTDKESLIRSKCLYILHIFHLILIRSHQDLNCMLSSVPLQTSGNSSCQYILKMDQGKLNNWYG